MLAEELKVIAVTSKLCTCTGSAKRSTIKPVLMSRSKLASTTGVTSGAKLSAGEAEILEIGTAGLPSKSSR